MLEGSGEGEMSQVREDDDGCQTRRQQDSLGQQPTILRV